MSERIKDGGPAFPRTYNGDGHNGMTLRDHFAATSNVSDQMKDMTSNGASRLGVPMPKNSDSLDWAIWRARIKARLRFLEADAMLAAREAKS